MNRSNEGERSRLERGWGSQPAERWVGLSCAIESNAEFERGFERAAMAWKARQIWWSLPGALLRA